MPCPGSAPARGSSGSPAVRDRLHLPGRRDRRHYFPCRGTASPCPGMGPARRSPEPEEISSPLSLSEPGPDPEPPKLLEVRPFPTSVALGRGLHGAHRPFPGDCAVPQLRLPRVGHHSVSPARTPQLCFGQGSRPVTPREGDAGGNGGSGTHRWLRRWKFVPRNNKPPAFCKHSGRGCFQVSRVN